MLKKNQEQPARSTQLAILKQIVVKTEHPTRPRRITLTKLGPGIKLSRVWLMKMQNFKVGTLKQTNVYVKLQHAVDKETKFNASSKLKCFVKTK